MADLTYTTQSCGCVIGMDPRGFILDQSWCERHTPSPIFTERYMRDYYSNSLGAAPPVPTAYLTDRLDILIQNLSLLRETQARLCDRLGPVLAPIAPAPGETVGRVPTKMDSPVPMRLSVRLDDQITVVQALQQDLATLLDRLEI